MSTRLLVAELFLEVPRLDAAPFSLPDNVTLADNVAELLEWLDFQYDVGGYVFFARSCGHVLVPGRGPERGSVFGGELWESAVFRGHRPRVFVSTFSNVVPLFGRRH